MSLLDLLVTMIDFSFVICAIFLQSFSPLKLHPYTFIFFFYLSVIQTSHCSNQKPMHKTLSHPIFLFRNSVPLWCMSQYRRICMLVLVFHFDFKAAHLTVQTATLRGQKVDIECDRSKRVELYCFANVLADIAYPLWSGGIGSKISPHFIEINQTHSFSSQAVFKYSSKSSDL